MIFFQNSVGKASLVLALSIFTLSCDSRNARTSPEVAGDALPTTDVTISLKQRQVDFLNRIRNADPKGLTIERAMINPQNELGLILDRSVELDKVPALMKMMLTQMSAEFPGEDLTVLAYTPTNPPHKIGTGRLNSRTRDMIYTPE